MGTIHCNDFAIRQTWVYLKILPQFFHVMRALSVQFNAVLTQDSWDYQLNSQPDLFLILTWKIFNFYLGTSTIKYDFKISYFNLFRFVIWKMSVSLLNIVLLAKGASGRRPAWTQWTAISLDVLLLKIMKIYISQL